MNSYAYYAMHHKYLFTYTCTMLFTTNNMSSFMNVYNNIIVN